ncbi:MAG: DEAD/DEAH box helicase [Nitrososphaeraceae archaeon]
MTVTATNPEVKIILDSLGYSSLYPPQELALSKGLLENRNLLITTPTASGKTLIAVIAAIKPIEKGLKVVYLTPLRAIATEKYHYLQVLQNIDIIDKRIRIRIATSDYDSSGMEVSNADVIILTNEKMDSVIRHGAEWIADVGLFVTDEVHLLGDKERGPTLEMILTKIRKMYPQSQILALSATVANSEDIAKWLGCELIQSNWRPTKLVEGVYEHGTVNMNDGSQFKIETSAISSSAIDIAIDSLDNGGQAIIFAETRKRASSLAVKAAEGVYKRLDKATKSKAAEVSSQILKNGDDTELTRTLSQVVAKGMGFHHAGLGQTSREIVEESFKSGIIKILTATPTLAAGVNLPARRVILASILRYDPDYGRNIPISVLEYKQLCGRAGRPKYDTFGESIIIAESGVNAQEIYDHYVLGNPEPLRSQMTNDKSIRVHLLSTIATIPGMKKSEIYELFESTLFAKKYIKATVDFKVDTALSYLESEEHIKSRNGRYIATDFGRRNSLLYIDPVTAVEFRKAIQSIQRQTTDVNNDNKYTLGFLHLITNSPDFYPKLSLRKKDVDELITIFQEHSSELFYQINEYECSRSLIALYEWVNETSDRVLNDRFGIEPGDMHRIAENSEWLAYSLYEVSKVIKREDLLGSLYKLKIRIKYGIKEELSSLVTLEGIGRIRARALYDAGLTNIGKVTNTSESKLSAIPKIGPTVAKKLKQQLRSHSIRHR